MDRLLLYHLGNLDEESRATKGRGRIEMRFTGERWIKRVRDGEEKAMTARGDCQGRGTRHIWSEIRSHDSSHQFTSPPPHPPLSLLSIVYETEQMNWQKYYLVSNAHFEPPLDRGRKNIEEVKNRKAVPAVSIKDEIRRDRTSFKEGKKEEKGIYVKVECC